MEFDDSDDLSFQTLPIFLDGLVTAWGAILISVTLILLFGEVRLAFPVIFNKGNDYEHFESLSCISDVNACKSGY